jgi:hypothetical protein
MLFSDRLVPEVFQTFWAAMARGEFITDAAAEAGTYRRRCAGWLAATGCQRSPQAPRWRSGDLPAGGHGFSPWADVESPRGSAGQWHHPLPAVASASR